MSNKIKRNAIKAASVGMAAMMAATPLTAFAAEETPVEGQDVVEASKVTQEATGVQETTKASRIATGANAEVTDTAELAGKKNEDGSKIEEKAAIEKLADAQENLDEMNTQTGNVEDAEEAGAGLVKDITELANQTNKDMEQASKDIADKNDAVNNATTVADAEAAGVEAAGIAEAAEKNFNAASEKYEEIQKKIETNKGVVKTAREAYETALANGSDNLASAKAELDAAEQLAIDLQDEADKASAVLAKEGAALIIEAQKAVDVAEASTDKEIHGAVWLRRDELFAKIIEFYYVPEVLKGSDVELPEEGFVRPKNEQVGENVANGGSQNANYYKVSYKDANGETKTVYLNYKVENNKLLIFAKEKLDVKYYNDSKTGKRVFITDEEFKAAKTVEDEQYVLLGEGSSVYAIDLAEKKEGTSTITKTVISENDPTYALDEDGNVVETVTGKVTTVTKTEKKLDGSEFKYKDADEAKKAAENAIKTGLADGETVLGDVTVETSYETTSDVTYDAVFTATIDLAGKEKTVGALGDIKLLYEEKKIGWKTFKYPVGIAYDYKEKAEAKSQLANDIATIIKNAGYTLVNDIDLDAVDVKRNFSLTDPKTWDLKHNTYRVVGNSVITVTFKKAGLSAGQVTTKDGASADSKAKENANTAIASVNPSIAGVNVNKKEATNVKTSNATSKFAYKDYEYTTSKTDTNTEKLSEKSYEAAKVQHDIGYYDNKNFNEYVANRKENKDKILLFEGTDKEFNDFLGKHTAAVEYQETISKQAQEAATAYGVAKTEVERLQRQLKELQDSVDVRATDDMMKAAELQKELEAAQADMDAAKATLDGLADQLTALAANLANKVAALRPAPADETPVAENPATETPATETPAATTPAVEGAVVAPAAATPVAVAPVAAAPVAAAPAPGLVTLNPVTPPLANLTLNNAVDADNADDADEAAEEAVNLQPLVEGEKIDTALADMTLEDDAKANTILGWWWLLIFAVLGGTGYTMYRKFQQKKAAEKIDKTK